MQSITSSAQRLAMSFIFPLTCKAVRCSASASTANQMKNNQPNEILGEALETEAIIRLSEVAKTLHSDLQQATLDCADKLLDLRDKTQWTFYTLKGLHQSDEPPNQTVI